MTETGRKRRPPTTDATREKQRQSALRRWARDGEREAQRERIAEGLARAKFSKPAAGHQRLCGDKRQFNFYIDSDVAVALRRVAAAQQKSVSEIIRTYVEWGLEVEGIET